MTGTTIDGHQCKPTRLAGVRPADAPRGTTVDCGCGKRWRVTHSTTPIGRICGWELIANDPDPTGVTP